MAKEEEKSVEVVEEAGWLENKLATITDGLDTYAGRDAAIVLLSYLPLFAADYCTFTGFGEKQNYAQACVNMFLALSSCRIMLRLFDDFGCVREYIRFARAQRVKQTVNSYLRWVFLINLFSNIIYNPCEHIAWLGELKVINASDQLWYFYTNVAWAFGLFTSVLINLRVVNMFYSQKATKAKREDDPNYDSSEIISESDMKLSMNYAIRDFADWCIAIHFMPEGFLWSGQLYYYQVGILGVISSWCRVETYVLSKQ